MVFFDECEAAFRSRNLGGGDRLLNSLLSEIERHEGIVFLATNRPSELDEAMHRRITTVIEYKVLIVSLLITHPPMTHPFMTHLLTTHPFTTRVLIPPSPPLLPFLLSITPTPPLFSITPAASRSQYA